VSAHGALQARKDAGLGDCEIVLPPSPFRCSICDPYDSEISYREGCRNLRMRPLALLVEPVAEDVEGGAEVDGDAGEE